MVDLGTVLGVIVGAFTLNRIVEIAVFAALTLAINLEYGWGGIPNFGKAAFIAMGAIASVIVLNSIVLPQALHSTPPDVLQDLRDMYGIEDPLAVRVGDYEYAIVINRIAVPWLEASLSHYLEYLLLSIVVAMAIGAVFGFLLSYPVVKLREDYLAIVLLMAGFLTWVILTNVPSFIGGTFGITLTSKPLGYIVGGDITTGQMVVALAVLAAFIIFMERLMNSPFGRVVRAARDDEAAAEAMGKNVAALRLKVIVISSMLSAVGGVVYTLVYMAGIHPDLFRPDLTFMLIAMMLLGGAGNNWGVVLGAVVFDIVYQISIGLAPLILGAFTENTVIVNSLTGYVGYIIIGLAILLVIFFRPRGILPEKPVKTPAWEVFVEEAGYRPSFLQPFHIRLLRLLARTTRQSKK